MDIKFLKAGTGDSILIHHNSKNILFDGGKESAYLLTELKNIHQKGEVIDLLVITHHDDDHISGIIDLLLSVQRGEFGEAKNFIRKIIFNSPRLILNKIVANESKYLSYKQAYDVEQLLLVLGLKWELSTEHIHPMHFEGLNLHMLLPLKEDLEIYAEDKGAYLTSDYKCDWKSPMKTLEKYTDDASQDGSSSNRTSIVAILEVEGKKVLLAGDATPDRLGPALQKLKQGTPPGPIRFDYVKLPHHGSYRSLNTEIIRSLSCINFIITANGKKNFLPNKRALVKILKHLRRDREPVNFLFNYGDVVEKLEITENEQKSYRFNLIPNNLTYGLSI